MGAYSKEGGNGGGGCLLRFPLNELDHGLVVPGKLTAFTKRAAIGQKLKVEITLITKLCKRAHGYRNNWK